MKLFVPKVARQLAVAFLAAWLPLCGQAKSYSSGGGHSYSSHSSSFGGGHSFSSGSHSFSSGGSHTFSSGGGHSSSTSSHSSSSGGGSGIDWHSSGGSGKSFSSGSGRSYSAGSVSTGSDKHSYTSGKSYTAGSAYPKSADNSFDFDKAAARAQNEASSKRDFTKFKDSQVPSAGTGSQTTRPATGPGSYNTPSAPPTLPNGRGSVGGRIYVPDRVTIVNRPARIYNVFNPYWSRPYVTYHDPYGSLFWWWLLDQSLEDRAWWAYHHRYDMDPYRYQALVQTDAQLEQRVAQLEAQQAPRDQNYVPTGLDRDLMYSDQHVQHLYDNRPTRAGTVGFWLLGVPAAMGMAGLFIWLIWFKRWQIA